MSVCLGQPLHRPCTAIAAFLVPFVQLQTRAASILSSLSDTPGAYSTKIRRGRGPASGKGKTAGRGQKGQKARGKVPKQFNGGQTPEEITHGKFGFKNPHSLEMEEVNLEKIAGWIEQKRLDPSRPITIRTLYKSKILKSVSDGVKLLGRGKETFQHPINIVVSRASQDAIAAVEAAGGTVTTRYYTERAIRRIKQGLMHPYISMQWDQQRLGIKALHHAKATDPAQRAAALGFQYRLPDPASRKDIEYYRDAKHRGYLSHLVQPGESASLFWKPPLSEAQLVELKQKEQNSKQARQLEENQLW